MPSDQHENIELAVLEAGSSSLSTTLPAQFSRRAWHPKITPYRLLSLLLPVSLGTVKAVASQQGQQNEPITLEWISGVVVFIVLFNTGTYECKPIQHIPAYLAWLFKYDCLDAVWWLRFKFSRGALARPHYISDEVHVEEHGTIYIVTSYRLLVCATVVTIGMTKAVLTYTGISTGATWVEWTLGVVISSILYIVGLYESNTIGLWPSFFGTDRAYVVRTGLTGTSKLLFILISVVLMSMWFFIKRPYASPDARTSTEMPVILRAYNQSMTVLVEGVFVMLFVLGAVVLFASLRSLREDLGNHFRVRVPLRIRVFVVRLVSFTSSTYPYPHATPTQTPTPLYPLRPAANATSALARPWAALRSLAHTTRHLLFFLLAMFLIVLMFSFSAGQAYRVATGDLLLTGPNGVKRGPAWNVVLYAGLGLAGTVVIVPAGVLVVWSLREMLRPGRRVYVARCAPVLRKVGGKVRGGVLMVKSMIQDAAARAVLGLAGLGEVESVHYAFLELVWTVRGDGLEIRAPLYDRDIA